jgi:cytochrome P450
MTPLIESRRAAPAGDIISDVAAANELGDQLTVEETLRTIAGLMLAGNETTTGALAGTMMYLVSKPDLQSEVRANPTLIDALVEEGMRLSTPAQALFRTATTAAQIGGMEIAPGERVYLRFAAANRDEARFAEPLCPRLDRTDKRHLAFGRGVHVCPGAPLARAELRIALETLLARTSSISLNARSDALAPTGGAMTNRVGALHLDIRC